MKKTNVNPLNLDKETLANLDEQELAQIAGGQEESIIEEESDCQEKSCMKNTGNCIGTIKTKE